MPRTPPVPPPAPPAPAVSFTLRELKAEFLKVEIRPREVTRVRADIFAARPRGPFEDADYETVTIPRPSYSPVPTLAEAQGMQFDCPLCHEKGTDHRVWIGFADRAPPDTFSRGEDGKDTRWRILAGQGIEDLQLAPSIWLKSKGGCGWHGFVGHAGVPPGAAR